MENSSGDFVPSQLGSKEYWDQIYANELNSYHEIGDVGEVWFGYGSVKRVVAWLKESVPKDAKILDIGCGNGITLIELFKNGYGHLFGVDYCLDAVNLARAIATERKASIQYDTCDIVADTSIVKETACGGGAPFDVCLDKGTYDAICLGADDVDAKKLRYMDNVYWLMSDGGLFIITSCNWTCDELLAQFQHKFSLVTNIPTPVLQFGGQAGKKETVLVLKKLQQQQ